MYKFITDYKPSVVVIDPITNLISIGDTVAVKAMLTRMIDFLKMEAITALFINLTLQGAVEETAIGISSLMDSWVLLRDVESGEARRRVLYLLKSRGMAHSNRMVEFELSERGITLHGDGLALQQRTSA
jgi:circadian clock protein KaiC